MKYNKKLYIIAAGLASRMGGYPKHICEIDANGTTNIEHTLSLASIYYKDIVVVLNDKLESKYVSKTLEIIKKYNAKLKFIDSGKGDGHAVYEAIKDEKDNKEVICIWGDTYFSDSSIFELSLHSNLLTVVCSQEISPYCYINVSGSKDSNTYISSMYFKSDYPVEHDKKYLHDQSTFVINVDKFKKYFSEYMNYCDYTTKTFVKSKGIEYSIIKFANWVVQIKKGISPKAFVLPERESYQYTISFNTKEELQKAIDLHKTL